MCQHFLKHAVSLSANRASRKNVYRCHLDFIKLSKITAFCCQTAQFRGGGSLATPFCVVNSSVKKVLFFLNLPIRSNNLLREPAEHFNGDDRDRTDNLCLARAALSQLSYVPFFINITVNSPAFLPEWAYVDSNHGPQLYQSCALTI